MPSDIEKFKSPKLAVDAIILVDNKIVLIERKNPPYGWAFPGGFVDYGESVESAVIREVMEETTLNIVEDTLENIGVYSAPERDPRGHVVSVVFSCEAKGIPKACDDAKNIKLFDLDDLPDFAFDHKIILERFLDKRNIEKEEHKHLEYTTDEIREKVLTHIKKMSVYWESQKNMPSCEKLDGLVFSILSMLDGCSMDLPGFIVAPDPHPSDKEYHIDNNEKYFPDNQNAKVKGDIAGCLHELMLK